MKIKTLRLRKFKRFDDLTIDLGDQPPRIAALVGPNGCGKSSIFDAFEEKLKDVKSAQGGEPQWFYTKFAFHPDPAQRSTEYKKHEAIQMTMADGSQTITKRTFHIRSPYRFSSSLNIESITAQPDILDDNRRPHSTIAIDTRLRENYERLLGLAYAAFDEGTKTGNEVRTALVTKINDALKSVLEVRISSLGNVTQRKGQLYFDKEDAKDFPYQNLSSGEKEVIDIIVDLVVRSTDFNDTVYCIDEPELHLNTAIQRKVLIEIEKLIPPNCQLWVATHSIGFLRALQDELADKCAILDFSEKNYFQGTQIITPMEPTRGNWQRIFETALDDLVGLIAPERIVYCEGRSDPDPNGAEQGLDAAVYNEVFANAHQNTLFISSGGTGEVKKNSSLAIKVLSKAFTAVELLLLHDRDSRTNAERTTWIQAATHHRMLTRREVENYLLDFDVLSAYCTAKGRAIARADYNAIVSDVLMQDLKAGNTTHRLKSLCGEDILTNDEFKRALAPFVRGTAAFADLERAIFSNSSATVPVVLTSIAATPIAPIRTTS